MAKGNRGGKRNSVMPFLGGSDVNKHYTEVSLFDTFILSNKPPSGYFQTSNSFMINKALRNDDFNGLNDDDKLVVQTMDKNMQPLTADIQVTRMADSSYMEALGFDVYYVQSARLGHSTELSEIQKSLVGGIVTEKGFMSTSYDVKDNAFKARDIRLNIKAKKGTKALFSPTGAESELVLARGTKYKITKVYVESNKLVIDAETA